ncbi:MAG: hypothetical protein K1X74_01950 [Pirellulales bacterium]|nr:hypothetical protein [Pirellulales bacterium]
MDLTLLVLLSLVASGSATPATPVAAAAPAPPVATLPPMPQLMSAERDALYRRLLPKVDDPQLAAVLAGPDLLLYTDAEIPPAYQFWDGLMPGVHSVNYNISANHSEPHGNGNIEFPWGRPAGTHRAASVSSFRFVHLPRDAEGRLLPILYYRKAGDDGAMGYGWTFPVGAIVGEVLFMRGPDHNDYTFELRIRRRERGEWSVNAYRPFPTAADLAARIGELRPDWQSRPQLAKLCTHLTGNVELPAQQLADAHPNGSVFSQSMGVDTLPAIDDDVLVAQLLTTTVFRSALGATWRDSSNGTRCIAPTTDAAFHVVPARYDAGFIDVDRVSCLRCHETTNQSVRRFDAGRDWYGRIRGSDGIFSFHPFSPGAVSHNGSGTGASLRSEFVSSGMIAPYSAAKHSNDIYNDVEELDE